MSPLNISPVASLENALQKVNEKLTHCHHKLNTKKKMYWGMVRKYLEKELGEFKKVTQVDAVPKTVFVSYSAKKGYRLFKNLEKKLADKGFTVYTGFQNTEKTSETIRNTVLANMRKSTIYIGLFTKDRLLGEKDRRRWAQWAPTEWVIEEKGMALYAEKPFILVADKGVHEDCLLKTTPEQRHFRFTGNIHFHSEICDEVIKETERQYAGQVSQFISVLLHPADEK